MSSFRSYLDNFEATNFGGDEWMRQLQQQEGLIEQNETSTFEQNAQLSIPSPLKVSAIDSAQDGTGISNQETGQIQLGQSESGQSQQSVLPQAQSLDGLHQIQGIDNLTTLNNLLQQQSTLLSGNTEQMPTASLGPLQTLERQLATLQQQQSLQPRNNQHPSQPIAATTLQESLLQLQKLQDQQQQIIKNIGLLNPTAFLNPMGSLLTSLLGQFSGNNTSTSNNTSNNETGDNNISNSVSGGQSNNGALPWSQIGDPQSMTLTNNPLQNPGGMMAMVQPQIHPRQQQRQPILLVGSKHVAPGASQLQQQQQNATGEPRQRAKSTNRLNKPQLKLNSNTNINIEFPTPPIIRKNDKKPKPRSFPVQLFDAMMTDGPLNDEAFEWLPDGKSFVVVNPDIFCKNILDRKFKQSKYGSFVRKLHRWGFIRLTSGTGTDCFHHPLFQRSRPDLATQIKCNSRNSKDGKKGHNAYARGEIQDSVQPSLMGVEKFIRAKVVSTETDDSRI